MRLALLGFSEKGTDLCGLAAEKLEESGFRCQAYALRQYYGAKQEKAGFLQVKDSVSKWTGEQFLDCDGLIFVGAVGIAVRMIAPYIEDKSRDPAVVAMDERGLYAIPLLSGHLGGANELAKKLAEKLSGVTGAIPVITTATDINGRFAVDLYAKERGLAISDLKTAKEISAHILAGKAVGFVHDFSGEDIPEGTVAGNDCETNIRVTIRGGEPKSGTLYLIPPLTVLGIGCRKGTLEEVIRKQVTEALAKVNISVNSVAAIGTIDLKAEEPGLVAFAKSLKVPLYPFSQEELNRQPGEFTASEFVRRTTGVDNVCERAAAAACGKSGNEGGEELVLRKQSGDGVTVAIAVKEWKANR